MKFQQAARMDDLPRIDGGEDEVEGSIATSGKTLALSYECLI
jgi:hypothetical protein